MTVAVRASSSSLPGTGGFGIPLAEMRAPVDIIDRGLRELSEPQDRRYGVEAPSSEHSCKPALSEAARPKPVYGDLGGMSFGSGSRFWGIRDCRQPGRGELRAS